MTSHGPGVYLDPGAECTLRAHQGTRRALYLDRDGVINVDHSYVHRREDTQWVPGIFELCSVARDAGYLLIVVTNQAGIARGLYDEEQFIEYTRWMHDEFDQRGVPLLATWYCPHHPAVGEGPLRQVCECRKPAPGMLFRSAHKHHVTLTDSVLLGDKVSDVEAGLAAGLGLCMLLSTQSRAQKEHDSIRQVETMDCAQELIIRHEGLRSERFSHVEF